MLLWSRKEIGEILDRCVFFRSSCASWKDVWFRAVNVMQSACRLWILSREIAHHLLTQAADLWIIFISCQTSQRMDKCVEFDAEMRRTAIVHCIPSCVRTICAICSMQLRHAGKLWNSFVSLFSTGWLLIMSAVLLYFFFLHSLENRSYACGGNKWCLQ